MSRCIGVKKSHLFFNKIGGFLENTSNPFTSVTYIERGSLILIDTAHTERRQIQPVAAPTNREIEARVL
jgi:hypothetical protein